MDEVLSQAAEAEEQPETEKTMQDRAAEPEGEVAIAAAGDSDETDMAPEAFRSLPPAEENERFEATIRFRGELQKPTMTGEGTEDELTVKVKVAGFDLSDLHHNLRPYAGRAVEAVILPLHVPGDDLPWDSPPHPDQAELPLDDDEREAGGGLVCVDCDAVCEAGVNGLCPACGGVLEALEGDEAEEQQAEPAEAACAEDGDEQ